VCINCFKNIYIILYLLPVKRKTFEILSFVIWHDYCYKKFWIFLDKKLLNLYVKKINVILKEIFKK